LQDVPLKTDGEGNQDDNSLEVVGSDALRGRKESGDAWRCQVESSKGARLKGRKIPRKGESQVHSAQKGGRTPADREGRRKRAARRWEMGEWKMGIVGKRGTRFKKGKRVLTEDDFERGITQHLPPHTFIQWPGKTGKPSCIQGRKKKKKANRPGNDYIGKTKGI